ncbi:HAD family hydrolase [Croceibacterium mercuriale]|uniref:capsular biosynthesis protein n=1 Tax=Croceibacterium mercuriale TaxID=1572751 RepID=UPI0006923642|nr:capsular biosynthesis protein [Croceibacterium mercuriale]
MIAKERVLVVDIDGTLCKIKGPEEDYATLACDQQMKARLIDLHDQGWRIILSSSRGMRTYDGNLGEILRHVLPVVTAWLDEHGVPYDEIWMGKPWPGRDGFYVDDRTVRPREFLNNSLEELAAICDRDRLL